MMMVTEGKKVMIEYIIIILFMDIFINDEHQIDKNIQDGHQCIILLEFDPSFHVVPVWPGSGVP